MASSTKRMGCAALFVSLAGLAAGQSTWIDPLGGNWNDAANWDTPTAPIAPGDSAILPNLGMAYEVICNTAPIIDSLQINGPTQTLRIDGNRTLTINTNAGIANEGLILINNATVFDARLSFAPVLGVVPLAGSGSLVLNGAGSTGDARLVIDTGTSVALSQPISGHGEVEGDGTLGLNAPMTADVMDLDLRVEAATQMGPGGSMQGTTGRVAIASSITGGEFLGGVELASLNAHLDGVEMSGENGLRDGVNAATIGAGGIVNNGSFTVNTAGSVFDAVLSPDAPCSITGTGTIDLNGAGSPNDARIQTTAGNALTIGSDQTVSGNGRFRANDAPVVFLGTALADRPLEDLTLEGTFDFMGTGQITDAGGIVLFNNADVNEAIINGAADMNGTSGSITNCTNNDTLRLRDSSTIEIVSGLTNNGTFVVNSAMSVFNSIVNNNADVTIDGSGTMLFQATSDVADARMNVDAAATLTITGDQSIEGSGLIDINGTGAIAGSITGTSDLIDLRLQGVIDLTGATLTGTTGTVNLDNADVTGGTTQGGVGFSGTSTVTGMTNAGGFDVRSSSTLEMVGDITNNSVLTVNPVMSVFDARLIAQAPVTVHGTGTIFLNGAGTPADAQLGADNTAGSLTLPSTQTVTGNGRVDGPATIGATLSPGVDNTVPGTIGLEDDLTLTSDATVELDIFAIDTFDRFTLTPDIAVDGTISLRLRDGYVPNVGDRFDVMNASDLTGLFTTIDTPVFGTRLFRVIESSAGVELLWTCKADVNLDGMVSPTDFNAWINAFNTGDVEVGDQNMDGMISPTDFNAWIANFNAGC